MTTKRVEIGQDWTLISGAAAGYMENQTSSLVLYQVQDASPDPEVNWGHILKRDNSIGWSRAVAKPIYAKTHNGQPGYLIVSEG